MVTVEVNEGESRMTSRFSILDSDKELVSESGKPVDS